MLTLSENAGVKRELIPAGVQTGVCSAIVDMGLQDTTFQGKTKTARKVLIMWELPGVVIDTEKGSFPRTISKTYTMSMNEKSSLRKMLQSWRGTPFTEEEKASYDLRERLGKGCLLSIVHETRDDNTYANIQAIMGLPAGTPVATPTQMIAFDLDSANAIQEMSALPEWIQERIKKSVTYATAVAKNDSPWSDDDIPFASNEDAAY